MDTRFVARHLSSYWRREDPRRYLP